MRTARPKELVHYEEFVAGWLDSSIHDFLEALPGNMERAAYALLTCLDCNLDPMSVWKRNLDLQRALPGARALQRALLVPSKPILKSSVRKHSFVGFDEIWFFPTDEIEPKPESAWIVGPNRIDQGTLDRLGRWMTKNNCSLGLGDGAGLNILVEADGLLKHILAHSISQPEPAFQMDELWVQDEEKKSNHKGAHVRKH